MNSYPEYFFIELTQNCNLYCTMCRPYKMADPNWHMSDELYEKVMALAVKYSKVADLRGWGESTLDKRLISAAQMLHDHGIKTRIYTNMCANDDSFWAGLARTGITPAISIETGIPAHYASLRRGGKLEIMLSHLKSFMDSSPKSLPYFTVVISEDNIDDLPSIVKLASEYQIKKIELNPISKRDSNEPSGRMTGLKPCDKDYATEKLDEMWLLAQQMGISVKVAANLFSEYSLKQHRCIHPQKYVCICYNGDVTFCDHLLHHKNAVMGNLCEQSFEEIWFGEKYQALRALHEKFEFDVINARGIECEWCCENRYGNSEYLVEAGIAPIDLGDYLATL